jgi:hypothetical protein
MNSATAVTIFHPAPNGAFDAWMAELRASAQAADGFVTARESMHTDPRLDIAVEVTFSSEGQLHHWLDSDSRKAVLRRGESLGFWRSTSDLVFLEGGIPPAGVAVFLHSVAGGKETAFHAAQGVLAETTAAFPGNEGTVVFPPETDGEWMSVIRFRTGHQLAAWLNSGERTDMLPQLRESLTKNFSEVSVSTPFGSTVRTDNGETTITPDWKMFLLVLVMLYPLGMLEKRFLDPSLAHFQVVPWLGFFVGLAVSVASLQWLLVPAAVVVLRRWLDPVDGSGLRTSLAGALILIVFCAAMLLLFATVKDLQFWDYKG